MKKIGKLGLFLFLGLGIAYTFLDIASSAGPSGSSRGPKAILANVPINGGKDSAKVILSGDAAFNTVLFVSPDKKWLFYGVQRDNGKKWEWGIIDPSNAGRSIKYAGSTNNGFGVIDVVWSPQSNEVAVGLGYKRVDVRWIRVSIAAHDAEAAKICSDMASTANNEVAEIVSKSGRSQYPVWGANGRYYATGYLARKDNVVTFQSGGSTSGMYEPVYRLELYDSTKDYYLVLVDNVAKMAHAFKDNRYIESFPVAARTVMGWLIMSRPDARLIAAKKFPVDVDSKGMSTIDKPTKLVQFRWVGIDLGKGKVTGVYKMARGMLIRIRRDKTTEVVFVETNVAYKAARK